MSKQNATNNAAHAVNLAVLEAIEATNTRQAAIEALPISDRFLKPIDFLMGQKKSVEWLVKGYLPLKSTTMIYGESGAGKTFAVLDIALHIATGNDWLGHKVKQGLVIYVAGEGQEGISARAQAWAQHHDIDGTDMTNFLCTPCAVMPTCEADLLRLTDNIDVAIKESGQQPVLIVFDTLARCFEGNENSSQDASAYIRAKDRLKKKYGACVLSVHHTGKDKAQGGRGSSAFKGAWDAEHCLSLNNGGIELSTVKMKEAEPLPPKHFKLESVTLDDWFDSDGDEVKSAVLVESHYHADYKPVTKTKGGKTISDNNKLTIEALKTAIGAQGTVIKHNGGDVLAVLEVTFRAAALLEYKTKNPAKIFTDNKKGLLKKGVINEVRDYVFFTEEGQILANF